MRKLLASGAGFLAVTAVLWEADAHTDSALVGVAVIAGFAAHRVAGFILGKVTDGHRKVGRIIANSEDGQPLFAGSPDEVLIAHAKRWGAEV